MLKSIFKFLSASTVVLLFSSCGSDSGSSSSDKGTSPNVKNTSLGKTLHNKETIIITHNVDKNNCESTAYFNTMENYMKNLGFTDIVIQADKNNKSCADYGKNTTNCRASPADVSSGNYSCVIGANMKKSQQSSSSLNNSSTSSQAGYTSALGVGYPSALATEYSSAQEEAYDQQLYEQHLDNVAYDNASYDNYLYEQHLDDVAYDNASYDNYYYDDY